MQSTDQKRFISLTLILALILVCFYDGNSAAALSTIQRSRTVATSQQPAPVVVVVKSRKANIRETPSRSGRIVTEVERDQRLTITRAAPSGPWYSVYEEQTGTDGWIHGSTIAFESAPVAATPPNTSQTDPHRTVPPPSTSGRSYINVDGVRVPSPVFSATRPEGSTARCRDGSYSFSQHRRGTCSWHGGVAVWY
jgi:Protein of unknown function (DUF3761)/Bacterial SH3 domain